MDAIAQIGQAFSKLVTNPASAGGGLNLGNILKLGLTGAGTVGDIVSTMKQNQALNKILYYQKNPAAASAAVASMEQPLSQGLTQEVGNNVQGYLAERGLAQSPEETAAVLGQALAPYQQQNQTSAENLFEDTLNPAKAGFGTPSDLTNLLKLWFPSGTATPGMPSGSNPFAAMANMAIQNANITPDPGTLPGLSDWGS